MGAIKQRAESALVPILRHTLAADAVSVLLSFPQVTYDHILVRISGFLTGAESGVFVRVNDQATSDYDYVSIEGSGGAPVGGQNYAGFEGYCGALGGGAPQGGIIEASFPDARESHPSGRRHWMAHSVRFSGDASGQGRVRFDGGRYDLGSGPLTSLRFGVYAHAFAAGTRFSIYGTKVMR